MVADNPLIGVLQEILLANVEGSPSKCDAPMPAVNALLFRQFEPVAEACVAVGTHVPVVCFALKSGETEDRAEPVAKRLVRKTAPLLHNGVPMPEEVKCDVVLSSGASFVFSLVVQFFVFDCSCHFS